MLKKKAHDEQVREQKRQLEDDIFMDRVEKEDKLREINQLHRLFEEVSKLESLAKRRIEGSIDHISRELESMRAETESQTHTNYEEMAVPQEFLIYSEEAPVSDYVSKQTESPRNRVAQQLDQ